MHTNIYGTRKVRNIVKKEIFNIYDYVRTKIRLHVSANLKRRALFSARIRRVRIAVCDTFLPSCESIFKMVRSMRIIL